MRALSSTTLLLVALTAPFTTASSVLIGRAEEDGPCTGASNAPGVCVPTGKCTAAGGKFISNACPGTPDDIKCCTKPSCGTGGKGNCRFTNTCSTGKTETDQCPGPATFKCCMPSSSGGGDSGGYPTPDFPSLSSGCKQTAIDGAKKIVNQFPGKIVEIGCKRACSDGDNSQHCNGMATDLMVTKIGVSLYSCFYPPLTLFLSFPSPFPSNISWTKKLVNLLFRANK